MSTELVKSLRTFTIISPGAISLNKTTGITGSRDMKQYYIALLSEYKILATVGQTALQSTSNRLPCPLTLSFTLTNSASCQL